MSFDELGPITRRIVNLCKATLGREYWDSPEEYIDALEKAVKKAQGALEFWMESEWCWVDSGPARVCMGPHVKVRYEDDKAGSKFKPVEVIESVRNIGKSYPEVPYNVITQ